jgi:hypothetical protein
MNQMTVLCVVRHLPILYFSQLDLIFKGVYFKGLHACWNLSPECN